MVTVVIVLTPVPFYSMDNFVAVGALIMNYPILDKLKAMALNEQCFTLWTVGVVVGMTWDIPYINIFQPGFPPNSPSALKS